MEESQSSKQSLSLQPIQDNNVNDSHETDEGLVGNLDNI